MECSQSRRCHYSPEAPRRTLVVTHASHFSALSSSTLRCNRRSPAEEKRLEMLGIILRDQLAGAGRFSFVAVPPEVQKQAAAGSGIPNCNGCERDLAEKTGAAWVAWGIGFLTSLIGIRHFEGD
jgi:hypothetical protein